jgi:lipopolysaccharide export system protein LptC
VNDATVEAAASAVVAPPRAHRSRWSRVWDQMSIYLPVVLMALLALASYLLLQATPAPPEPEPERVLSHEPDYFMKRFSVKVFSPTGSLHSELYGAAAQHHPDTDTLVVESARIRSYSISGTLSTATANQITTNGEGTEFLLEGDAIVVRQAGRTPSGQRLSRLEFHGDYLKVNTVPERIVSDQPVLLMRDQDQITADTLDYQGESRVVELNGRVRAKLVSRLR